MKFSISKPLKGKPLLKPNPDKSTRAQQNSVGLHNQDKESQHH
jgi:hypothetical protein